MNWASCLRIAVIGGGPAGSFFALYALKYARLTHRDISVTIYEPKDFGRFGQQGCNMCAGIVPSAALQQLGELGLAIPPGLVLSRVSSYALHTSTCTLGATDDAARAEIVCVYRGAGPRHAHRAEATGFDELLLEEAIARGASLRREKVDTIRRGPPIEVTSAGRSDAYDLAVLATGINARLPTLEGFHYQPPPTVLACQTELYLGEEEVQRRLGSSVHIFLPPDDIASYGILIPKGPFVTTSLLRAREKMVSLQRFLALDEVRAVLGTEARRVCGCLPKIAAGAARGFVEDGFVAVGDASTTRLYKNGIGSALATAERAAWTAIHRGCQRSDFGRHYLPLCRAIDLDNWMGRLLFLEIPVLKRFRLVSTAHCRLAGGARKRDWVKDLHTQILWGMFTGAYSYRDLLRMVATPGLAFRLALSLGSSLPERNIHAPRSAVE